MAPSWVFYPKMLLNVLKASKLSKKGLYTRQEWVRSSLNIVKALESVGVHFVIRNAAIFQKIKFPCVFVSNHMSVLETFVLPCLIQPFGNVTFVVKESLIAYPFFKNVLNTLEPIVVGRANPREDLKTVLNEGQQRLNKNISVIIFPQTTRSVYFDPKKFNSLGVKLAKRAKVPLVPVALKTDAWGVGKKLKDFGKINPLKKVCFSFGSPLYLTGSGRSEHESIKEFIVDKLSSWH